MPKKYNYKMKTGRPEEYKGEATIKKVNEYLDSCKDEYVGLAKIVVRLPSIEGLALYLDISRSTLYLWKENHSEFSDILDKLLSRQAEVLLNKGLSGDYNPTISKLVLAKHGYRDSQEITGKDGKDLIPEEAKLKANEAIITFLNGTANPNNTGNNTTWNGTGN